MAKASSKSSSQSQEVERSEFSLRAPQRKRGRAESTRVGGRKASDDSFQSSAKISRSLKSKKVKKVSISRTQEIPPRTKVCPSLTRSQNSPLGYPRKRAKIRANSPQALAAPSLMQARVEQILLKLEGQFSRRIDQAKTRLLDLVDCKLEEIQTQLRNVFEEVPGAQTPKRIEPELDQTYSNCFDQSPSLLFEARSEHSARDRNTPAFRTPLEEKFFTPSRADPSQVFSPFSGLKPQFDLSTSEPLETLPTLSSKAVCTETQKKVWSPFSFHSGDDNSLANHLRSYFQ